MPIWHILHPDTVLTDTQDKAALVKAIVGRKPAQNIHLSPLAFHTRILQQEDS